MKSWRMTMRWGCLLLGGLLLWLTLGTSAAHAQSVDFGLTGIPDNGQVLVGQHFTVTVEARAGAQEVDTAVAFLTFDPSILQVITVTVGSDLDFALEDIGKSFYTLDNSAGTLSYQAGILGGSATGTFTLFALEFAATSAGQGELVFVNDAANDRYTAALRAGVDLLGSTESAQISAVLDTTPGDGSNEVYLPLIARERGEIDPNAVRAGMAEPELELTPADEAPRDETQTNDAGIGTDATNQDETDASKPANDVVHIVIDEAILPLSDGGEDAESRAKLGVQKPISTTVLSDAHSDSALRSHPGEIAQHAVFLPMAPR